MTQGIYRMNGVLEQLDAMRSRLANCKVYGKMTQADYAIADTLELLDQWFSKWHSDHTTGQELENYVTNELDRYLYIIASRNYEEETIDYIELRIDLLQEIREILK